MNFEKNTLFARCVYVVIPYNYSDKTFYFHYTWEIGPNRFALNVTHCATSMWVRKIYYSIENHIPFLEITICIAEIGRLIASVSFALLV